MRSLKKVAAVALTAVMTMAMSAVAFADQTITFHFQNNKNWDPTGAWIYQGIAFTTNVTPADKCAVVTQEENGVKQVWPGAKMDNDTKEGWKSVQATFTDSYTTDGMVLIFNNYVADSETNDTTTETDIENIKASGIPTTANATKEQTGNVIVNKKLIEKAGGSVTDVYVEFDGSNTTVSLNEAPAAYTSAADAAGAATETTTAAAATTTKAATGVKSATSSPKTGDSVAVSVVLFGIASAVAFVAANKKKVEA